MQQLNANGLVSVQQLVNHLLLHSKCQRKLRTRIQLTKPCQIKVLPQYPQQFPQMAFHGAYQFSPQSSTPHQAMISDLDVQRIASAVKCMLVSEMHNMLEPLKSQISTLQRENELLRMSLITWRCTADVIVSGSQVCLRKKRTQTKSIRHRG